MSGDDNEIGEKSDLTRIEDLSEFLHQNDPELDAQLDTSDSKSSDDPPPVDELPGLDDLEDSDEEEEYPSFESVDNDDEFNSDDSSESEEFSMESTEDSEEIEEEPEPEQEEDEDEDSLDSSFEDSNDESFPEFDSEESEEMSFDSSENEEEEDSNDFDTDFETDTVSFEEDNDINDDLEAQDEVSEDDTEDFETEFDEVLEDSNEEIEPISVVEDTTPTPAPRHVDKSEKFEDVKSFAKNITYGKIGVGGNPAFSVILRNVKFEEDAEDIIIILNEHGLVDQVGEEEIRNSLEGGSLLISQISEFSAIYLTHKFRRFNLDIQMGLSDELHPSKSYERDSVGLVSKNRVNQNKNETTRLESSDIDIDSVILSTTPTLENYKITEYLGIVTEFVVIDQDELTASSSLSEAHERQAKGHLDSEDQGLDEESIDLEITHDDIYRDLSEKLRPQCIKKHANAVVGINYQITPLTDGEKYKVSCSGSAVWVTDSN